MSDTKTAPLDQLRQMKAEGKTAPTKADAKPVDMPKGFWDKAELSYPVSKKSVNLRDKK